MATDTAQRDEIEYLTLAEAAASLPLPRTATTLWRWASRGICGVRLRTAQIGRTLVTTRKWLHEFTVALDAARRRSLKDRRRAPERSEPNRRRRGCVPHSRAVAELEAAGL